MSFKKLNITPLVAKEPAVPRDSSKLMVIHRKTRKIEHKVFSDITDYLNKGDCLVLNNSKVFPAKLLGKKSTGGKFELLLVRPLKDNKWLCLTPKCYTGMEVLFDENVRVKAIGKTDNNYWIFAFSIKDVLGFALKKGVMPLPPYIEKKRKRCGEKISDNSDYKNYQTIYAKMSGSIAAPTAGLHFTRRLLQKIKQKQVKIAFVTLHIGWGTFKPLKTHPAKHKMLAEFAEIDKKNADIINNVKKSSGRIFSVGTTTTRTLESFAKNSKLQSDGRWVDLFIYPSYKFKIIDCLITNFHLPNATPICMTAAFAGEKLLYNAYKQAVEQKYRFYSYGDAMLIT